MSVQIAVAAHPRLGLGAFVTVLPGPLGGMPSPASLTGALRLDAPAPVKRNDAVKDAVRDMLRHGGFKPAGRSKPASEYLLGAAERGELGSINTVVDACNVASLHSGLPISVIDLDRAKGPFSVQIAPAGTRYVFNASGQELDLSGLVALFDMDGPCANAVKDSQRTKTHAGTRRTLSVVWGASAQASQVMATVRWYRALLADVWATTEDVAVVPA